MIKIVIYETLFSITGPYITQILFELRLLSKWNFTSPVSLGSCMREGFPKHYIMSVALVDIVTHLYYDLELEINVSIGSECYSPARVFEPWIIPSDKDTAIAKGYLKGDYSSNAFCIQGDWRSMFPVI